MAHQSELIGKDINEYLHQHEQKELLRFITCGSVDDGKSTLIGRLLHDSKMIYEDQLASIHNDSKKVGTTEEGPDLALLVDGLQSEREQGITIDVAYRYFSTDKRKFIIADTPGHEQYTRNMATGASTADLAIILIDARYGVQVQTKRHSFIVSLLGIKRVIVAVNKMDLVDFSQEVYEKIVKDYQEFTKDLGFETSVFIPVSALKGDNVVDPSDQTPWYDGKPLIHTLENISIQDDSDEQDFRLPVQYVNRPNLDFRGFCGTIASGVIRVGDEITVLPSQKTSKVKSIITWEGESEEAYAQMAVTLTLEDEIDISRGDLIVKTGEAPEISDSYDVNLVWMTENSLQPGKNYYVKCSSSVVNGTIEKLHYKKDVNTLEEKEADLLHLNEIGFGKLSLEAPIAADGYRENRQTGSFVLIDRITNNTVGAGMIVNAATKGPKKKHEYTEFELELNALVRKHFPHWGCKSLLEEL